MNAGPMSRGGDEEKSAGLYFGLINILEIVFHISAHRIKFTSQSDEPSTTSDINPYLRPVLHSGG